MAAHSHDEPDDQSLLVGPAQRPGPPPAQLYPDRRPDTQERRNSTHQPRVDQEMRWSGRARIACLSDWPRVSLARASPYAEYIKRTLLGILPMSVDSKRQTSRVNGSLRSGSLPKAEHIPNLAFVLVLSILGVWHFSIFGTCKEVWQPPQQWLLRCMVALKSSFEGLAAASS